MATRQGFDTGGWGPYHARAMGNPLRDRCTAAELASVKQVIEIADKIGTFNNLTDVIATDLAALEADKMPSAWRDNVINGRLEFGFVDVSGRVPSVSGSVAVGVDAVCQRCLEPFQLQLSVEPKLVLLTADETVEGHDEFEVWELDQQTVQPDEIVEELLIMAMPFSATHESMAECKAFQSDDADAEEMIRPFAALRLQMAENETDLDN